MACIAQWLIKAASLACIHHVMNFHHHGITAANRELGVQQRLRVGCMGMAMEEQRTCTRSVVSPDNHLLKNIKPQLQ
jgi:hypothetical protein